MIVGKRTISPALAPVVTRSTGSKLGTIAPPAPEARPLSPAVQPIDPRESSGFGGVSVSGPNLPTPGHSGFGWIRDTTPLAGVPPVVMPPLPHEFDAPVGPNAPGAGVPMFAPATDPSGLAEPNNPSTADNPGRFALSPAARHADMYRRLPDVGGFSPWQGISFKLGSGRIGGVPSQPAPVNAGVQVSDPYDMGEANGSSASSSKNLRRVIAGVRRSQKRVWNITPGVGGLDVAMGVRAVPDTPSGVREAIRDKRAPKLYGSFAGHSSAPKSEVERTAMARNVGAATAEPVSSPVSTPNPGTLTSSGTPAKGSPAGALVLAALAAFLIFGR